MSPLPPLFVHPDRVLSRSITFEALVDLQVKSLRLASVQITELPPRHLQEVRLSKPRHRKLLASTQPRNSGSSTAMSIM